jgi:hypothetical protein
VDFAANIGISIVSLVVGAALGVWLGEFVKRPKLTVSGTGMHRVQDLLVYTVHLTNEPRFIGISFESTTLLGKTIHKGFRWGQVPEGRATECHAILVDADNPRLSTSLYLSAESDPERPADVVRIESGGRAQIYLFVRRDIQDGRFFLYAPASNPGREPRIPEDRAFLAAPQKFVLRVGSSRGEGRRLELPVSVIKDLNGDLRVEINGSSLF